MSLLSTVSQNRLEETIVSDGYLSQADLATYKAQAETAKMPLLTYLIINRKYLRR